MKWEKEKGIPKCFDSILSPADIIGIDLQAWEFDFSSVNLATPANWDVISSDALKSTSANKLISNRFSVVKHVCEYV